MEVIVKLSHPSFQDGKCLPLLGTSGYDSKQNENFTDVWLIVYSQ